MPIALVARDYQNPVEERCQSSVQDRNEVSTPRRMHGQPARSGLTTTLGPREWTTQSALDGSAPTAVATRIHPKRCCCDLLVKQNFNHGWLTSVDHCNRIGDLRPSMQCDRRRLHKTACTDYMLFPTGTYRFGRMTWRTLSASPTHGRMYRPSRATRGGDTFQGQ